MDGIKSLFGGCGCSATGGPPPRIKHFHKPAAQSTAAATNAAAVSVLSAAEAAALVSSPVATATASATPSANPPTPGTPRPSTMVPLNDPYKVQRAAMKNFPLSVRVNDNTLSTVNIIGMTVTCDDGEFIHSIELNRDFRPIALSYTMTKKTPPAPEPAPQPPRAPSPGPAASITVAAAPKPLPPYERPASDAAFLRFYEKNRDYKNHYSTVIAQFQSELDQRKPLSDDLKTRMKAAFNKAAFPMLH